MTRTPTISVIIPVYNTAAYIGEAIVSIRGQTCPVSEIIVVDDGSTDDSAQVVQAFQDVHYLYQEHHGIAVARNHGLAAASGDFIAFLDSDDLWSPDKIERQMAVFEEQPDTDFVIGQVEHFYSPDLSAELRAQLYCPPDSQPGLSASSILGQREAIARVGEFDVQRNYGEFIEWYSRLVDRGCIVRSVDSVLVKRRIRADNTSRSNPEKRADYALMVKSILDRRRGGG